MNQCRHPSTLSAHAARRPRDDSRASAGCPASLCPNCFCVEILALFAVVFTPLVPFEPSFPVHEEFRVFLQLSPHAGMVFEEVFELRVLREVVGVVDQAGISLQFLRNTRMVVQECVERLQLSSSDVAIPLGLRALCWGLRRGWLLGAGKRRHRDHQDDCQHGQRPSVDGLSDCPRSSPGPLLSFPKARRNSGIIG